MHAFPRIYAGTTDIEMNAQTHCYAAFAARLPGSDPDPHPPPNPSHTSSSDLHYCPVGLQVSGLTCKIHICFRARVHFGEDFLEVIADSCQNGSVRRVGPPVGPQGDVTEQACLPLAPQLAQHVSAV